MDSQPSYALRAVSGADVWCTWLLAGAMLLGMFVASAL